MESDPVSKSLEWSRKGYMGMALLLIVNERALSGYDIMRLIRETTQGFWRPTPGGVYPVLKKLEAEGLIQGEWFSYKARKRKLYMITDEGKKTLERVLLKQSEIALGINRLFGGFVKESFGLDNPLVAPPSIFSLFMSDLMSEDEAEELEARRKTILCLMESLQRCLDTINAKLEEEKDE